MYTLEKIKKLREKAYFLKLNGCELLEQFTDEELQKICNGIGAEWFPEKVRKIISAINPSFEASALLHDLMYHIDYGFDKSNELLKINGKIEAKAEYSWYNPIRYIALHRAKVFSRLCQKFGKNAYNKLHKLQ